MMRWGSMLFVLPLAVLLVQYGFEMSAINGCTSEGLYYDPIAEQCVSQSTAMNPFYARHTGWVNGLILLSFVGSMMMTLGMIKRGSNRE